MKPILLCYEGEDDQEEQLAWCRVRLIRSGHDMWTLEVSTTMSGGTRQRCETEHILVQGAQIDRFKDMGIPIKNPLPVQPPKKVKR